jgi:hypothetical protein
MPDVSKLANSMSGRPLRNEEQELVRYLLSSVFAETALENTLVNSRVTDMQDGSMGSIRFVHAEPRTMGKVLVEAQCVDGDGVLVSIAVNGDQNGQLFEMDFWKVDFSPLKRYPKPGNVVVKR